MRLIDADALLGSHWWDSLTNEFDKARAKIVVMSAPTVDAVEVVQCKDCKWRNTRGCPYLNFNSCARDDLDFCSDGERRTDGKDTLTITKYTQTDTMQDMPLVAER